VTTTSSQSLGSGNEAIKALVRGEIIFVGELRNARADAYRAFDSNSGDGIVLPQALFLSERRNGDRVTPITIIKRCTDMLAARSLCSQLQQGQKYLFALATLRKKHGVFEAWMDEDAMPELVDDLAPVTAT
jgi:hypothetical protein